MKTTDLKESVPAIGFCKSRGKDYLPNTTFVWFRKDTSADWEVITRKQACYFKTLRNPVNDELVYPDLQIYPAPTVQELAGMLDSINGKGFTVKYLRESTVPNILMQRLLNIW